MPVVFDDEDGDDGWRVVLCELVKRAKADVAFRARVQASGAILDDFEEVLGSTQVLRAVAAGVVACRVYWWGFQLELPHAVLAAWNETTEFAEISKATMPLTGAASPFRLWTATWIAGRVNELKQLDRGAGVYANMTWMAPNIFVPLPIR